MADSNFIVKNGLTVGNVVIDATTGNITGVNNLTFASGTDGVLAAGNSNVTVTANSNVSVFVNGNATARAVFTDTGANIAGTANITGNANVGNLGTAAIVATGTASVTGNANVGNLGTATAIITTGNIATINSGLMQNGNSNVTIAANANVSVFVNGNSTPKVIFNNNGSTFNDTVYVNLPSSNAQSFETSAGLSDTVAVMEGNVNSFVQFALHNIDAGGSASSDFIAYMDGGDNTSGFIDMGITSSGFNDPVYGSTDAGDGYLFMSAGANLGVGGNLVLATDNTGTHNDIVFAAGGFFAGTEQGRFRTNEGLQVQGNISAVNGAFYQGADAKNLVVANGAFPGSVPLTNVSGVFTGNSNSFVQFALNNANSDAGASTDLIVYADNGDNDSGWMDMGITSSTFNDITYGVTGPNDGYIFMSAPAGTTGNGSMFISTSDNGAHNDIVFSTGGFAAGTEKMRIIGESRVGKPAGVEIYINTNSTSTSTGALRVDGGMGLQGNLNVGGEVVIVGNLTFGGNAFTLSAQTLDVTDPIIFTANGNPANTYDQGIVAQYVSSGTKYSGMVKDATDQHWKFFDGLTTKPTTQVDFSDPSIVYNKVLAGEFVAANTTAATSTTTGALKIAGGAGIAGNIYIGGNANITGTANVPTANITTVNSGLVQNGTSNVTIATNSNVSVFVAGNATARAVFTSTGANIAGTANVTGNANVGNLGTATAIITTGNITTINSGLMQNGNSNIGIAANGNVTISVTGTANIIQAATTGVSIGGNITLTGNIVDSGALDISTGSNGNLSLSPNGTGQVVTTANINAPRLQNGNSGVAITANANVTIAVTAANSYTFATGSFAPNGNGTQQLGLTSARWSNIWGLASSAQYADLAERYDAGIYVEPGTVVEFGGDNEVQICGTTMSTKVAGVVSTAPGYLMNDTEDKGDNWVPVALQGRVPTKVVGPVAKGDMMVSAGNGHAMACSSPILGSVIGKSLENFDGTEGIIEVVIGRV